MSDVYNGFLKALLGCKLFRPEKIEDQKLWVDAYKMALGQFSDEALSRAAQAIIVTRESRSFPLPAECIPVCREAAAGLLSEKRGRYKTKQMIRHDEWERKSKIADTLFAKHPEAKRSIEEEWWWRLWSWMQENERMPDVHELRQIEAKGKADYRKYLEDIQDNKFAKALNNWRSTAYNRVKNLLKEHA